MTSSTGNYLSKQARVLFESLACIKTKLDVGENVDVSFINNRFSGTSKIAVISSSAKFFETPRVKLTILQTIIAGLSKPDQLMLCKD